MCYGTLFAKLKKTEFTKCSQTILCKNLFCACVLEISYKKLTMGHLLLAGDHSNTVARAASQLGGI